MPLAEHDWLLTVTSLRFTSFNSRAPRGARLDTLEVVREILKFQFTCPSRSTTWIAAIKERAEVVSIHVPLAEHDTAAADIAARMAFQFTCPSRSTTFYPDLLKICNAVSIHVPLAEHDYDPFRV